MKGQVLLVFNCKGKIGLTFIAEVQTYLLHLQYHQDLPSTYPETYCIPIYYTTRRIYYTTCLLHVRLRKIVPRGRARDVVDANML